jgi:hypothetical protein
MKTLSISVILVFACLFAYSQKREIKTDAIYFKPENKSVFSEIAKQASGQPTDLAWVKQSLGKYHQQRQTGFILQFVGLAATTSAFFIKDEQMQQIAVVGGAALSFSGIITMFSAEKHLKTASLPMVNH